jgi:hypothetical protein
MQHHLHLCVTSQSINDFMSKASNCWAWACTSDGAPAVPPDARGADEPSSAPCSLLLLRLPLAAAACTCINEP